MTPKTFDRIFDFFAWLPNRALLQHNAGSELRYLTSNHGVALETSVKPCGGLRRLPFDTMRLHAGQISALFSTGLGVREDPVLAAKWQRWKDEQRARDRSEPVPLPWSEKPIKWPDRGPPRRPEVDRDRGL